MAWFDRNPGEKRPPDKEPEKPSQQEVRSTSVPPPVAAPQPPAPTAAPKVEALPKPLETGLVAHLYKGSRVTGQLSFQGSAKIDGSVDGEIRCQGTLTVGEGAEVKAKIFGDTVVIRGKVEGNVAAKEKIELAVPARLHGNINTPRLVITEGVVFEGDCSMGAVRDKAGVANSQSVIAEKAVAGQKPKLQADSEK
jgi:cytoskeletal protein CcmA (bactofilin family)